MRRFTHVLLFFLVITGASAATLEVIVTGSRTVSSIKYGNYPYTPTTNYEYNLLVVIPGLNYTNAIQRTSPVLLTYGQVTNYIATQILSYAASLGTNTSNLNIVFKRP